MTIDHYSERKICRGPSLSSNNSNASNHSMSSHLLVPEIHVFGSESLRDQSEPHSGRRVLPIRSGSFRDQTELERENKSKRPQVTIRTRNRRESPDISSDTYYYLKATANQQRRRSSLPAISPDLLHCSNEDLKETRETKDSALRRVRSFKTTTKGVVNRGDSVRKRGGRSAREGSDEKSRHACTPSPNPARHIPFEVKVKNPYDNSAMSSYYKVVVLGAIGVGKTSITQQFMTSEYVAFDNSIGKYLIQLYIPCTLP